MVIKYWKHYYFCWCEHYADMVGYYCVSNRNVYVINAALH